MVVDLKRRIFGILLRFYFVEGVFIKKDFIERFLGRYYKIITKKYFENIINKLILVGCLDKFLFWKKNRYHLLSIKLWG